MAAWLPSSEPIYTSLPHSELEEAGYEDGTISHNTTVDERTTETGRSAETVPGHHSRIETNGSKCPICDRGFVVRKTMLRHLRTVHAPKDLACPTCKKNFIRQDNLNRHFAEQHSSNDHFVTCGPCGRRISKRGLPEHLRSRICKASRAKFTTTSSEAYEHLYAEDKNDCFLLTMRVLNIWLSLAYLKENQRSGEHSSSREPTSQGFTTSDAYYRCCSLGNRALDSMKIQMRDSTASQNSLKLFCTALLWACISLVGVYSAEDVPIGFRDWNAHLKGAAALLRVFHSSICSCDKSLLCPQLQQRAAGDPAMSLFKAIVRDTELHWILLRALPSLVTTWEHAIGLIDVLLQCLLDRIDRCGEEFSGRRTLCEANGIASDNGSSYGLMALIWTLSPIQSDGGPRSSSP